MKKHFLRMAQCLALSAVILGSMGVQASMAAATKMASGFYYPTDRASWTGNSGGSTGDPKQPWNDGGSGGTIYGYMDPKAPSALGKNHVGMDIRTPYSAPIYAVASGTINSYSTSEGSRYYCIIVKHQYAGGTFYAVYGHCRLKSGYSVGKSVAAGENFGYINENVNQHIHFGIKMNSDFSKGWGHLATNVDAAGYGWRGPRTWLSSNSPVGGGGGTVTPPPPGGGGTTPPPTTDTTAPTITIGGPQASTLYNSPQSVTWNVTDSGSGVSSVTMAWDYAKAATVSASGSSAVALGEHTITITATDKSGNKATKTAGPYVVHTVLLTVGKGIFTNKIYVQQHDCTSGMTVELGSNAPTLAENDKVYLVGGTTKVVNGETVLTGATLQKVGVMPAAVPVVVATNNMDKLGILVKLSGMVSYVDPDGAFFYVDDSNGVTDGVGDGIRVICDGFADGSLLTMPALGDNVTVTGIASVDTDSLEAVKAIRTRRQSDIQ